MGVAPLGAAQLLSSWAVHPVWAVVVVGLAGGYLTVVHRLRRGSRRWPGGRTASFLVGVVVLAVATMGWCAVYGPVLFWVEAAQVLAVLLVVPLLLALGAPVSLLRLAAPARIGRPVDRLLDRGPVRVLTYPVLGPLFVVVVPFTLYFTPLDAATLRSGSARGLLLAVLLLVGFVLAYPLGEGGLNPGRFSYPLAMFVAFLELLLDAFPGIVLRYRTGLLGGGYWTSLRRGWGPTPLVDQQHAGALWWFFGEAWDLPLLLLLLVGWMRADHREAVAVDTALDAAHTAARNRSIQEHTDGSPQDVEFDEKGMIIPWWHTRR